MSTIRTLAACGLILALGSAHAAWDGHAGDVLAGPGDDLALTTAWLGLGDPDAPLNLSGHAAVDVALVEAGAGVDAYALDLGDEAATEGSVAWRTLAVGAGDVLAFDWAFATEETDFADHAFAALDGTVFTLTTAAGASTGHFEYVFDTASTLRFAVGVVDTVDVLGVSTLQLSALSLTPAVPEPGTAALWLAGGAALWARRRRDQAAR